MEQFDEMIKTIVLMRDYLSNGKMLPAQVPVDNLMCLVQGEYSMFKFDDKKAASVYRKLLEGAIEDNDAPRLVAIIDSIIQENEVFNKLYHEKTSKDNMMSEAIIYRVETFYHRNREKNRLYYEERNTGTEKSKRFVGKGAVYSAVIGGYDEIRDPEVVDERLDYYLFTDSDGITSDVWKVIKIDNPDDLDSTRLARKIKIIGCYDYLKNYDFTIWCDGKMQIVGDIFSYMSDYSEGAPILCFNHYFNDDIYQEAEHCIILGKDDPDIVKRQLKRYQEEGFPDHSGIIDSCFIVRDSHDDLLRKTMNDWWNEVFQYSKRDQLSFNYVCWKNHLLYDTSPLVSFKNAVVRAHVHLAT